MAKHVIFIDIDGPMIPMRAWVLNMDQPKYEIFDPVAAATILRVVLAAGAKIVISSSWRTDGHDACVRILEMAGIDRLHLHEDWRTPITEGHRATAKGRAAEIYLWLAKHPEVEHHAVLDDMELPIPNLVHVSMDDGILLCHQKALFGIFNLPMT
jgi:hypothetical protein